MRRVRVYEEPVKRPRLVTNYCIYRVNVSRIGKIERRTLHKVGQDTRRCLVTSSVYGRQIRDLQKIGNHSQTPAYPAVLAGPGIRALEDVAEHNLLILGRGERRDATRQRGADGLPGVGAFDRHALVWGSPAKIALDNSTLQSYILIYSIILLNR